MEYPIFSPMRVSPGYKNFLTNLIQIVISNAVEETLRYPHWRNAMDKEIQALLKNETWEVVEKPKDKKRWGADGYSLSSINLLNHYSTLGLGITFKKIGKLDLAIYIDSDYAGSLLDFRSTTGFCTILGGNLVTWRSIKQNVVSKSSTEGEF